jgi:flagellar biosynthesis chaperone FliJ
VREFEELKCVISDMKSRKDAMHEQLTEFRGLGKEIENLREKAPHDVSARRRLLRLEQFMKNGGEHLIDRLNGQVTKVEKYMKGITDDFAQLSQGEAVHEGAASRGSKPRRKSHRAFV